MQSIMASVPAHNRVHLRAAIETGLAAVSDGRMSAKDYIDYIRVKVIECGGNPEWKEHAQ